MFMKIMLFKFFSFPNSPIDCHATERNKREMGIKRKKTRLDDEHLIPVMVKGKSEKKKFY